MESAVVAGLRRDDWRAASGKVDSMRLTHRSDYAVRVLTYLTLNRHRRCTIGEIAGAYGVSKSHLTTLAYRLGQRGFIKTSRGAGGGLELARSGSAINLGAVIRAVEPDFKLAECFAGAEKCACPIAGSCEITRVLELALQAFFEVLDRHTLEDLVTPATALKRILAVGEEDRPGHRRVSARGTSARRP